ncbi:hypothetical protein LMG26686_03688 [Achromobacter mucicolens]|uniref:hypothetical protein n=1 Tax=Achromobacter mucicolens TaxID=1389922 RepID=UPI0014671F50|nr:hypothetical protein [Achromobacter mucicolens]CAB3885172.1 hypothetical protein LMG26686_03688 [Achromobacter mucicolens]
MKIPFRYLAGAAALIAAQCYAGTASAQWLDAVKGQMEGAGQGSATQGGAAPSNAGQGGILQGLGKTACRCLRLLRPRPATRPACWSSA